MNMYIVVICYKMYGLINACINLIHSNRFMFWPKLFHLKKKSSITQAETENIKQHFATRISGTTI